VTRPSSLTPEVTERLCKLVRDTGAPLVDVCRAAGVAPRTVQDWTQRGRAQKSGRCAEFRAAYETARSERVLAACRTIIAAAREDWRAEAWLLEHTDPRRWSPRLRHHREADLSELLSPASGGAPQTGRCPRSPDEAPRAMPVWMCTTRPSQPASRAM
jgi:transposase-like protein